MSKKLRDLYLLLAGCLAEIKGEHDLLSQGFNLEGFPETSEYALNQVENDESIPPDEKTRARADFEFCMQAYKTGNVVDRKRQKQIDDVARALLRSTR